jgi:ABC-type multidrug transport system fused ATPase/permease subunit
MGCFSDILNHAMKDKQNLAVIVILCFIIAVLYILRNYYIGQIVQNLSTIDLFKYSGITILYFILHVILLRYINGDIIHFNKNIFSRFVSIFFKADIKNVIEHNESIMSDMNESFQNIGLCCQTTYTSIIQQSILLLLTIFIFLYYQRNVGIILIVTLIGIYFLQRYNIGVLKEKWKTYWTEYVKFNKLFQDVMLNIWSVKYNTLETVTEKYLNDRFKNRMGALQSWLNYKIVALDSPDFTFFVVIIYNLYSLIHNKTITTDIRVFLILQLLKVWKEFHILCSSSTDIYQNIKYIEKICPVWTLPEKEIEKETDEKIDSITRIEFKNVSFSYGDKNILSNKSFTMEGGKTVSLLGKSGGGKSTIVNLICKLYEVNSGEVAINGININNISTRHLRECINVVPQNFNVFDMTIKENILIEDEYNEKRLNFLVKLLDLPDINSDAKKLSHGQKQRVIIGRTLYRENKSVYIFDEYLSAVDHTQSKVIHDYVLDFIQKNNKIGIFISHNQERIYSTDKIIKL